MNIRDSKKNKKSDAEQFSEYVCPNVSAPETQPEPSHYDLRFFFRNVN